MSLVNMCTCCIVLYFSGSLISWISRIFNCLQNYFNEKFLYVNCSFHMQECRWTTCCWIHKGHSPKRYLWSRHCFCWQLQAPIRTLVWQCVLDKTCLYAKPILHYMLGARMVYTANSQNHLMKFSKTTTWENLDPRKFGAIGHWTMTSQVVFVTTDLTQQIQQS